MTEIRAGLRRRWQNKVALAVAGAALIIFGALAAPMLWQTGGVSAGTKAAEIAVPAAQLDSSLDEDQAALSALYELVSPSVVNIQVESTANRLTLPGIPGVPLPDQESVPQVSEGSGFIYDNDGHIVTNNHVVDDADKVIVTFDNGMWARATVVATDPQADLAVIKVTPPDGLAWRPLTLAAADSLKVGHMVIAIGNPFGLEGTMTTGIVSALGRGFPVGSFGANRYTLPDVIQTDAAINPGNSGGPLLNLRGEVVGVNFAIESTTRQNSGVGFAIPVSIVQRVVPALISEGRFEYAYLGLEGSTITPDLAEALDLPDNTLGVYVSRVIPGGPSATGGLKGGSSVIRNPNGLELRTGGDIVTAIDDMPVRRFEDLVSYLVTKAAPGQTVTLTVQRDGSESTIEVTLGTRPTQAVTAAPEGQEGQINARAAIAIAEQAVKDDLQGQIVEKVATPDERDGNPVWIVELTTDTQKFTVVVDAETGDVLDTTVE
ncbi:MAG: trypsin-like peptidase domain-containing protein [Caldilineaceae bacterium]|nr:trypsin-like peptidase domain-containing protein [Caldilineaceae bacterium]